jgi:hypothetical protein
MTNAPTLAGKLTGPPPVSAELVEVVPLTAELVKANPETANLPGGLLANIEAGFRDAFAVVREHEEEIRALRVTSIEQRQEMKRARELRLELKNARVAAEKVRKTLKADALLMGRAIDGANNLLLAAVEPLERHLKEQEEYVERIAAEQRARLLEERKEKLAPFAGVLPPVYGLETMTAEEFDAVLENAKILAEAKAEREKREEAERIERGRIAFEEARKQAEAEEAERARLRKEAEEARAVAEEQRKKAEAERQAREAAEAQARAEREARERIEAQRAAEEEAARKKAEAAARRAAQAPDREKLTGFASEVRKLTVPEAKTEAGRAVAAEVAAKVEAFAKWIEGQAANL